MKTKQNKQTNISAGSHNKLKYFRARLCITGTVTNSQLYLQVMHWGCMEATTHISMGLISAHYSTVPDNKKITSRPVS
jgi:hypothetical protein